jgi:hypothetical protein
VAFKAFEHLLDLHIIAPERKADLQNGKLPKPFVLVELGVDAEVVIEGICSSKWKCATTQLQQWASGRMNVN